MKQSETTSQLMAAFIKAQPQFRSAMKAKDNTYFHSKYADLAEVLEACKKPLIDNGFAIMQPLSGEDGEKITITTRLVHTSGEWVEESVSCRPKDGTPQAFGSAATYLRRYSLASLLGVVTEDDDGATGSGTVDSKPTQRPEFEPKKEEAKHTNPPTAPKPKPTPAAGDKVEALKADVLRYFGGDQEKADEWCVSVSENKQQGWKGYPLAGIKTDKAYTWIRGKFDRMVKESFQAATNTTESPSDEEDPF